jgi:peptide/nickel transport system substrate-binding protein
MSIQLLEEAGWVDDDNDIETPRVATDAVGTVEAGTPLTLELTTFTGNLSVDSSSILIQDQLKQVGIGLTLDIIEFTPMLDKLVGQTYDMLMVFWGVTPTRPQDMYDQLGIEGDVPGAGFNSGSYYNEEFEEVMLSARSLPGCDQEERKALYDRAQEIIHEEVPYYLVNTSIVPVLIQNNVENVDVKTNSVTWNLPSWTIR